MSALNTYHFFNTLIEVRFKSLFAVIGLSCVKLRILPTTGGAILKPRILWMESVLSVNGAIPPSPTHPSESLQSLHCVYQILHKDHLRSHDLSHTYTSVYRLQLVDD